jgi:uncharacterized membrane protein (UPF0182 family)
MRDADASSNRPTVNVAGVRIPSDLPPQPRARRRRRISHRGRIALIAVVALLFLLFLSARGIAGFWTDYLWFDSLGFGDVFRGLLLSRVALALIFTLIFATLLCVNLWVADRLAPRFRQSGPEDQFLERYQEMLRGRRVWFARIGVSLLFGLIAGIPVASQWRDWILFTHPVSFGAEDPLFGVDIGFYVFRLPFLSFVMDWLFASLVIILIITAVAHYLNGGIRLQVQGRRVTPQVKAHLSVLLALLAILRAFGYWLQRYELLTSTRGFVDGATYTSVKAELPAINLLFLISILAAVLLVVNIWQRGWRLPIIAVGLWGLVAVVAGTIYPAFVQRFVVQPAESSRERPYIQRNIEATRAALGLNNVEVTPYRVDNLDTAELPENAESLKNVRLLDPEVVPDTFKREQGLRGYYEFNDLDVDRYEIDGRRQQVVLAARELSTADLPIDTWEGRHLAYTHGYGVAMAPASQVQAANGTPNFLSLGEGGQGPVLQQPAIYHGEQLPGYAVVGTNRAEISFDPATGAEANTRYQGEGGVAMGSILRRAAFALRFGEWNLMVSNLITKDSRMLYVRDVADRVELLAPFLSYDSDPYPVVVNGRIVWVLDAYTTTDRYPYAQMIDTSPLPSGSGLRKRFNYARNSIKATVDAYDGTVSFYIVDPSDPLALSYAKAFPDLFVPLDAAPPELVQHFRYPEDLFKLQTTAYARYHISDPSQFYQRANAWSVAQNPPKTQTSTEAVEVTNAAGQVTRTREARMPPYYTMLQLPGQPSLEFLLLRPFVPFSDQDQRKELQAIMTASSDQPTYGRLRVLLMDPAVAEGPAIVDSDIKQTFAGDITLLDQQGSRVTFGDMQMLPIGNSLVYVRPWFVSATRSTPVPTLRYVTVTYQKRSVKGSSLEEALAEMFPGVKLELDTVVGGSGVTPPTAGGGEEEPTPTTTAPGTSPSTAPPAGTDVEALLEEAQQHYDLAQAALREGRLGVYQDELTQAYRKAAEAASKALDAEVTVAPGATTTVPATSTTVSG